MKFIVPKRIFTSPTGEMKIVENEKEKNKRLIQIENKKQKQDLVADALLKEGVSLNSVEGYGDYDVMTTGVRNCTSYLEFLATDPVAERRHRTLFQTYRCHNRMCPMCSMWKAGRDFKKLQAILKADYAWNDKRYIFITLTIPSVLGSEIDETVRKINRAVKKLYNYNDFGGVSVTGKRGPIKGMFRKDEATHNKETELYHIHVHLLCSVNKMYFKSKKYISKKKLLGMWQKAYGDKTITQVDIKKIYALPKTKTNYKTGEEYQVKETPEQKQERYIQQVSLEVAKYVTKDTDFIDEKVELDRVDVKKGKAYYNHEININQQVFHDLYVGLKYKKMTGFYGSFTKLSEFYEKGKLDEFIEKDENVYVELQQYRWLNSDHVYDDGEYSEMEDSTKLKAREKGLLTRPTNEEIEDDIKQLIMPFFIENGWLSEEQLTGEETFFADIEHMKTAQYETAVQRHDRSVESGYRFTEPDYKLLRKMFEKLVAKSAKIYKNDWLTC